MTLLKLYLPHRTEQNLKPPNYATYEEFYNGAAVKLSKSDHITPVRTIVETNRATYEQLSEHLQDAWEQLHRHGQLEDAWAAIAPQTEQDRLEDIIEQTTDDKADERDTIPDLIDESNENQAVSEILLIRKTEGMLSDLSAQKVLTLSWRD